MQVNISEMGTTESKEENIVVAQQAPQVVPVNSSNSAVGAVDIIAVCFVLMTLGVCAYFAWCCLKREVDIRAAESQQKISKVTHV